MIEKYQQEQAVPGGHRVGQVLVVLGQVAKDCVCVVAKDCVRVVAKDCVYVVAKDCVCVMAKNLRGP